MKALCLGVALCAGSVAMGQHSASYPQGAVAADHPDASAAGARILLQGGNAVDAAVATSLALSVCRPASCGIGGGGFMVIALPDDPQRGAVTTAINYRETAPAAVGEDFYAQRDDRASLYGGAAVAVPGTVAGLAHAHERYGVLEWAQVVQPAIDLAEHGFARDRFHTTSVATYHARAAANADRVAKSDDVFLRPDKSMRASNPSQAAALRLIAEHGPSALYEGKIAEAIVDAVTASGGVMTAEDLRDYKPVEVDPMRFDFAGRTFLTMPPPSSGGIAMLQTLEVFERASSRLGVGDSPWASAQAMHVLVEATKHAFADRSRWLADPAFAPVPIDRLTSDAYLDELADRVTLDGPLAPEAYGTPLEVAPIPEDGGTSHLCAVDQWGGAVSCTETINTTFGSLVVVPGFGFVLNNEMDDFQARRGKTNAYGLVQSDWNLPSAGKRPLSSMSPTIVLDEDGAVVAMAGAAGGPRIITATTQTLLRVMLGESAGSAIEAQRVHHQWSPDVFRTEEQAWADWLGAMGHEVSVGEHGSAAQAITRTQDGWEAASDPRKGGRPAGH